MRTLIMFSLFCLASCREEALNEIKISVIGTVKDSLTKAVIPNAKVTILTWYDAGFDKTDYVRIDTITDNNGHFAATFETGYKVTVASVAANYYPSLKSSDKQNSESLEINLMLMKKPLDKKMDSSSEKINLTNYIIQNSEN
jgi:hypothetical protein